ncbi:Hpt domain-containing protein [Nitratireductor basaltis]|uniref:Histidine kinase n=1 Tax=Nitratireductor basaltis TaxID=472175 RepID=A0A084UB16_9HYPH|nr:Hpt domain-containing protein [Nitratireductor basaltis]KFB10152.1 Histidine kinase [Nitratireductor basaltis]
MFDLEQMDRQTLNDPALRDEVLRLFVDQLGQALEILRDPMKGKDELQSLAHQILGTARALGARPLAEVAHGIEQEMPNADPAKFQQLLSITRAEAMALLERPRSG